MAVGTAAATAGAPAATMPLGCARSAARRPCSWPLMCAFCTSSSSMPLRRSRFSPIKSCQKVTSSQSLVRAPQTDVRPPHERFRVSFTGRPPPRSSTQAEGCGRSCPVLQNCMQPKPTGRPSRGERREAATQPMSQSLSLIVLYPYESSCLELTLLQCRSTGCRVCRVNVHTRAYIDGGLSRDRDKERRFAS